MKKIFIDTNIFLDFYRNNQERLKVLDELKKFSNCIIFPVQVYEEYKRNRVGELEKILSSLKEKSKVSPYSTSIINSLSEYEDLTKIKKEYDIKLNILVERIQEMIDDPEKDIIFKKINEIFKSDDVTLIEVKNDDIERAKIRQLLGNPPGSNKLCIGDELIWEGILSNIKSDLVIVSRDLTYKNNLYVLREEYKQKTGKEILEITSGITSALKLIGENPDIEVIKIEEEQIEEENIDCIPDGWNIVDKKERTIIVSNGERTGYTSSHISYLCPYCGNYGPWNGIICLTCGHRSEPD